MEHRAEVAPRGAEVMPFRFAATTQIFTKTASGGTQRVVAKNLMDATQVGLIRQHLRDIQSRSWISSPEFVGIDWVLVH